MPLYDFICVNCGLTEELLVKNSEEKVECPECKETLERKLGLSSFRLKGDGWYKDGYSKKEKKND